MFFSEEYLCYYSALGDQGGYFEKSEIHYRLRFIFLPMFNTFGPI